MPPIYWLERLERLENHHKIMQFCAQKAGIRYLFLCILAGFQVLRVVATLSSFKRKFSWKFLKWIPSLKKCPNIKYIIWIFNVRTWPNESKKYFLVDKCLKAVFSQKSIWLISLRILSAHKMPSLWPLSSGSLLDILTICKKRLLVPFSNYFQFQYQNSWIQFVHTGPNLLKSSILSKNQPSKKKRVHILIYLVKH